jgi:DNA sulfur modification protein DndB
MATVVPAIRGHLGETDYYEVTMKARQFVQLVRPPRELDEWANFSIEERMQREPDNKRILTQIAPYIANNADRFFGSFIVLVYNGELLFEPFSEFGAKLPGAYKDVGTRMGFLTLGNGTFVVLDGQHRYLALRLVLQGEVLGGATNTVSDDDVSVIFVQHTDMIKTRRIFNVVNRYAKQTSRADNIITSEDDGYAIVARRLLNDDQPLGGQIQGGNREELVDWKSNTLGARSVRLTTLSAVFDSVKLILEARGVAKLSPSTRPSDTDLLHFVDICASVWDSLLKGMKPYELAAQRAKEIPKFRADTHKFSLLFKPASQIALLDGLLRAQQQAGLSFDEAVERANRIEDWSMRADLWTGIIIKGTGAIDAGADARRRMAQLVLYLIAADKLPDVAKYDIWKTFNEARGKRVVTWIQNGLKGVTELEPLPIPIEGKPFTIEDATNFARGANALA